MKPSIAFILFLVFLFPPALAQPATALYDFGTMQQGNSLQAQPGDNVTFNIFFFVDSEYGNRITHVRASTEIIPEGWSVEIDPPLHNEQLNISGILTNSSENLYVEPRPVLSAVPDPPEEGIDYLASPSGKGYLQARKLQIHIQIPPTAELGKSYTLKVQAEGFWFGQKGNIALKQSRSFIYSIELARKEYSEEIIKPVPSSGGFLEGLLSSPWALAGIGGLILLAAGYLWLTRFAGNKGKGKSVR